MAAEYVCTHVLSNTHYVRLQEHARHNTYRRAYGRLRLQAFACLSACLSACLNVCLPVCLSVCIVCSTFKVSVAFVAQGPFSINVVAQGPLWLNAIPIHFDSHTFTFH